MHHYHSHLYALDRPLQAEAGQDAKSLTASMAGHVLGDAELVGTYQRMAWEGGIASGSTASRLAARWRAAASDGYYRERHS